MKKKKKILSSLYTAGSKRGVPWPENEKVNRFSMPQPWFALWKDLRVKAEEE